MDIEIEKIIYPGKSLGRYHNKVVLTNEGLPGERVRVSLLKDKKSFIEAETKDILASSTRRVIPKCRHYKVCSPYQYISYPFQLEIKSGQLREILLRQAGIDSFDLKIRPSLNEFGYRNKVNLLIARDNSGVSFAYNSPRNIQGRVKIDKCFLFPDIINRFLKELIKIFRSNRFKFIEGITIRINNKETEMLLGLKTSNPKQVQGISRVLNILGKKFPLKGIMLSSSEKRRRKTWGVNYIRENFSGRDFFIGIDTFFQVNIGSVREVIRDLSCFFRKAKVNCLADLYCGTGMFGIVFSERIKEIIGIDSGKENIEFLKQNLEKNRITNFRAIEGDCRKLISKAFKYSPDALMVNPPRAGLTENICRYIIRKKPQKIFYLSCNPVTLSRDLKNLLGKYTLLNIYLYDFFPQTPHIETLAVLESIH